MKLQDILQQQADYTRNSDVTVNIDKRMPWVDIRADEESSIFLDGDSAEEFLAQCEDYSEQVPDMDMETIELAVAYKYLDVLL
jgi:hypothetical protein